MESVKESEVKRTSYLHEAGHAIVALDCGLIVHTIECDGEVGHCHADLPASQMAILSQVYRDGDEERIAGEELLSLGIAANRARLATYRGGGAGESLVQVGRSIFSTRRASDDISTFFAYLNSITRKLNAARFAPVWQSAFVEAQDTAWATVRRR